MSAARPAPIKWAGWRITDKVIARPLSRPEGGARGRTSMRREIKRQNNSWLFRLRFYPREPCIELDGRLKGLADPLVRRFKNKRSLSAFQN